MSAIRGGGFNPAANDAWNANNELPAITEDITRRMETTAISSSSLQERSISILSGTTTSESQFNEFTTNYQRLFDYLKKTVFDTRYSHNIMEVLNKEMPDEFWDFLAQIVEGKSEKPKVGEYFRSDIVILIKSLDLLGRHEAQVKFKAMRSYVQAMLDPTVQEDEFQSKLFQFKYNLKSRTWIAKWEGSDKATLLHLIVDFIGFEDSQIFEKRAELVAESLLEHGARADVPDKASNFPITYAAENGHPGLVALFLRHYNERSYFEFNKFIEKALSQKPWILKSPIAVKEILLTLIKHPNFKIEEGHNIDNSSPLYLIAKDSIFKEPEIQEQLKKLAEKDEEHRAQVAAAAIVANDLNLFEGLYKPGLVSVSFGTTMMHIAAQEGRTDVIQWLVMRDEKEAKNCLTRKNQRGETPIFAEARTGSCAGITALIKLGVSPLSKMGKETLICYAAFHGNLKAIKTLLGLGATLDSDDWGDTPMHHAARSEKSNLEVIKFLKECNIPLDLPINSSPIEAAIRDVKPANVKALISLGANPNGQNNNFSLLETALLLFINRALMETQFEEIILLLLNAGAVFPPAQFFQKQFQGESLVKIKELLRKHGYTIDW